MILGYDFIEERLYSDLLEEEKLFAWAQLAKKAGLNEAEKRAVGRFRSSAASFVRREPGISIRPETPRGFDLIQGRNSKELASYVKKLKHAKMRPPVDKLNESMFEALIGKPANEITRNDVGMFKNDLISGLKKISNL